MQQSIFAQNVTLKYQSINKAYKHVTLRNQEHN